MSEDWSVDEVDALILDYLSMLDAELSGAKYSKTEHRRSLTSKLRGRSDSSIERKHMNLSAVLRDLGMISISGYKPYGNYQKLLAERTIELLERQSSLLSVVREAVERPVTHSGHGAAGLEIVDPPEKRSEDEDAEAAQTTYDTSAGKFDFVARELSNRSLGLAGERLVVDYERRRLRQLGLNRLAERVEHVAETRGDGLGYDIASFEPDESPRLIEVKTTAFHSRTPFFITARELEVSIKRAESYCLYRVFDFRRTAKMFHLKGAVDQHCRLKPRIYVAEF